MLCVIASVLWSVRSNLIIGLEMRVASIDRAKKATEVVIQFKMWRDDLNFLHACFHNLLSISKNKPCKRRSLRSFWKREARPVLCAMLFQSETAVTKSNMYSFVKTSTDPLLYSCEAFRSIRALVLNFKLGKQTRGSLGSAYAHEIEKTCDIRTPMVD